MHIIVLIAICLTISLILSELFARMNYPRVIGQILSGIVLGVPFLKVALTGESLEGIGFLSELAIVFLLLLAGLEINLRKFERSGKDALIVAFFSSIVPFVLGFLLIKVLSMTGFLDLTGYRENLVAIVTGMCLSLTAEGTTLNVLIETKTLNTKLGTIILGAGIIDDVFEILSLAVLLIFINGTAINVGFFPIYVLAFVILSYTIIKFVPKLIRFIQAEHSRVATVSTFIVIALVISAISQIMGIGPIIGAFIAGLIIQWANKNKKDEQEDVKELSIMAFSFIVPFFFINIGLNFDFTELFGNFWLALLIILVATFAKILGAIAVVPFSDLTLRQAVLVGWGMNARGSMELVIAEIARMNGLIPMDVYSSVVLMAITTTLIFPFILKRTLVRWPHIMDDASKKKKPEQEKRAGRPPLTLSDHKKNLVLMDLKHEKDYNM